MNNKNINLLTRSMLFLIILIFSASNVFAGTVVDVAPMPQQGASHVQTIVIDTGSSGSVGSTIVRFDDSRITWQSIRDWNGSLYQTVHQGRINVPPEVPAGTYRFRLYNSGHNFGSGGWSVGHMVVRDFSWTISISEPGVLPLGAKNFPLVLTMIPPITNYTDYSIIDVESTIEGITVTSGKFLNSYQILLYVNVALDAEKGPLGFYIKYGIPLTKLKRERLVRKDTEKITGVNPTRPGDFSTIYLSPFTSILVVEQGGPTVQSVEPPVIARGDTKKRLLLTGSDFEQGMTVNTDKAGVQFSNTLVLSSTQAYTYVTVSDNAPFGNVPLQLQNSGDDEPTESTGVLRVVSSRPYFISVNPNVLIIGQNNQQVCINGGNFTPDTYLVFENQYVSVVDNGYRSGNELCPTLNVSAESYEGATSFNIFNDEGIYARATNAIMLSKIPAGDKTIKLLYPGREGGYPIVSDDEDFHPLELVNTLYPVFRWYSRAQKYKISVYKPLPGQSSFQEVINNIPLHEAYVYGENYFQYPLYARELETGIRYFWKVDAYFNTDVESEASKTGEVLSSEVWSFVVDDSIIFKDPKEDLRFGTLNPVKFLLLEPDYVEIAPGDRASVIIRGLDKNGNYAAFIPNHSQIDYNTVETNYPDLKILPKSFGRAEIVVPSVYGNRDFQQRLLRNPAEFARFPVLLYISKNAKGVGALLVTWQKKQYYALINVLPPEKAILREGEIDRFRIGIASRQSEAFRVVMDEPANVDKLINGKGKIFIDSAGFRNRGNFDVTVSNVRVDVTGRALSGTVTFEGRENIEIAGYDITINKIHIKANAPAEVSGTLMIPSKDKAESVPFTGFLSGLGELRGTAKLDSAIELKNGVIPENSVVQIDFSCYWSPEFKKHDPSFRGLILSVENSTGRRTTIVTSPEDIPGLSVKPDNKLARSAKIDLQKYLKLDPDSESTIYLSAVRDKDGKIRVNWLNKDNMVEKFNIYRRTNDESQYRLIAERLEVTEFLDIFTDPVLSYWYKVVGINDGGLEIRSSNPIKIDEITNQ